MNALEHENVMEAVYAEVAPIRNDIGYIMQETANTRNYLERAVAGCEDLSCRVSCCEEEVRLLKSQITRDILEEVARRFRNYFDTTPDPVSDEEFYKDLQELLFG